MSLHVQISAKTSVVISDLHPAYFVLLLFSYYLWPTLSSHVQCITSFEIIVEKLQTKSMGVNGELKVNYKNGNSLTNCEGLIQQHVSIIIVP